MQACAIAVRPGEPRASIYTPDWIDARQRIETFASSRVRERYTALFDHVEDGWSIIRPLALWADAVSAGRVLRWAAARDAAAFFDVDVADVFRSIAADCVRLVPVGRSFRAEPDYADIEPDAESVARNLRLARLACVHPEYPPDVRELVPPAASAFTDWTVALPDRLHPIAAIVCCAWLDGGPVPAMRGALHVVR